jgi:hypothetical protein
MESIKDYIAQEGIESADAEPGGADGSPTQPNMKTNDKKRSQFHTVSKQFPATEAGPILRFKIEVFFFD